MKGLINQFILISISGYFYCARSIGVCSRVNSLVSNNGVYYYRNKFCCDNYERHENGSCLACRVGYTSKAGFVCTPCLKDTFGFRCADKCQCDQSKRCDNVHGCVSGHFSNNLSTQSSVMSANITQNETYSNNSQTATSHLDTNVTPTRTELHSSVWTSPKSKENEKNNGFIDQSVLIYIFTAVTGALMLIIGLCLCLICVCWKRHVSSKKKNIISLRSAVPLTLSSDIQDDALDSQGTSIYGYEVIDEAKMEREIPVIQNNSIIVRSPNTNSGISPTDSDGYLNPFHSIIYRNSISCKDDKSNVIICEERQYLELPEAIQCISRVQQRENCELVKNDFIRKDDDDSMYEIAQSENCIGDQVIIF